MHQPFKIICLPLAVAGLTIAPASAQETSTLDNSATSAAADAFGERVGINQVGLYSEWQTRGFDLNASVSAFRINGFYFHPTAFPSNSIVAGSSVNVGIAAAALDLPSPTGVIGYRLREPGERSELELTTGLREYLSPQIEGLGTWVSGDQKLGLVAHAIAIPKETRGSGQEGRSLEGGGVLRFRPAPHLNLRVFGALGRYRHDGTFTTLSTDEAVPPSPRRLDNYSPDWARNAARTINAGALLDYLQDGWSFGASAIRSGTRNLGSDVAVLDVKSDGLVDSTIYHTPATRAHSNAFEIKGARAFDALGVRHRIGVGLRERRTRTGRALAQEIDGGEYPISDGPNDGPEPDLRDDLPRGEDRTRQRILSLSYGMSARDNVEIRTGIYRTRYEKDVSDFDGSRFDNRDSTWLYSASAIWRPRPATQIFTSFVTGLEEVGSAPAAASNRGEVLPPVKSRQIEVGARQELAPGLALIAAAFDIRKETYGLRRNGLYASVGTVRHRGIEASLAGRIGGRTTITLGANLVQPRLSGELVDAGDVLEIAPGVSRFNATASFEHQLARGWSIDGWALFEGARRRDSVSRVETPGVPFATLGTRYAWTLPGRTINLRAQAVNLLGVKGYYATPFGPLVPVTPRGWQLLLTTAL